MPKPEFDVFLCYNSEDLVAVRSIGRQLQDQWNLRPGLPWQRDLEAQISRIKSAAVFVGKNGFGPWQSEEIAAFLREFVRRRCPVMPVILPTAKRPKLPVFLKAMTWVDFNVPEPDPLDSLTWGITGNKPVCKEVRIG